MSNGDAWGSSATAATVGRKSSHPATRQRTSYAKKELAEGKEVRQGTRIGTDAETAFQFHHGGRRS